MIHYTINRIKVLPITSRWSEENELLTIISDRFGDTQFRVAFRAEQFHHDIRVGDCRCGGAGQFWQLLRTDDANLQLHRLFLRVKRREVGRIVAHKLWLQQITAAAVVGKKRPVYLRTRRKKLPFKSYWIQPIRINRSNQNNHIKLTKTRSK